MSDTEAVLSTMRITVKVFPDARRERVTKKSETSFEVSVRDQAKRNTANRRICEIFASLYTVSVDRVRIVRGHRSSQKSLEIIV